MHPTRSDYLQRHLGGCRDVRGLRPAGEQSLGQYATPSTVERNVLNRHAAQQIGRTLAKLMEDDAPLPAVIRTLLCELGEPKGGNVVFLEALGRATVRADVPGDLVSEVVRQITSSS